MDKKERNMDKRRDKINYYLDIAEVVAKRATCLRKKYGSVIVKNDEVISTGYNGAPRGRKNCSDIGTCLREKLGIPRGERYELCRAVHSEANAIISASREQLIGSSVYMVCLDGETDKLVAGTCSCSMCKRLLINAGIEKLYVRDTENDYRVININDWVENDESLDGTLGY